MIGKTLSHYRVLEALGRGGMGEVYLAQDTSLDRKVALKFLPEQMGRDPTARRRFLREAKSAAALDHPYICNIHEVDEAEGRSFIAMEYVRGKTLADRLAEGPLAPTEALRVASEISEALEKAHGEGIVHRDLKPTNIMLTAEGHAKVMDFGLAKRVPADKVDPRAETVTMITQDGSAPGTLGYMSPEQIRGREADTRSDIFSFGIVLFEMVTGVHPFRAETGLAMSNAILNDPPPPPESSSGEVPPLLQHTLQKMLAKEVDARYQSIHEVRTNLASLLREEEPTAASAIRPAAGRPWAPSAFRVGLAVLAVVLVGLIAGLLWWLQRTFFPSPRVALGFEERDWILVTDVENLTNEELFDQALDTALTVSIQQSRYVNVFPHSRIPETLRRMGKEPTGKLDQALATEIALREGIKALLVCGISRVGDVYSLTARLVDPHTQLAVLTKAVQASDKDHVLPALDDLANEMRKNLGESLRSIAHENVALPDATTSSLEALKTFVEGRNLIGSDDEAAWGLIREAVELDPDFALAHAELGAYYYRHGNRLKGEEHFTKASSLLDRLTVRERLWIEGLVEEWRGNREQAILKYKTFLAYFPDDGPGWFRLGYQYLLTKQCDRSIEAFNRANEIAPDAGAYINIATCYNDLGAFEQAIVHYRKGFAIRRFIIMEPFVNHEYGFTLAKVGETERAKAVFERTLAPGYNLARGHRSLALLAMYQGLYSVAIDHLKEAVLLNKAARAPLSEMRDRLYLATAFRAKGMTDQFEAELSAARELQRENPLAPSWLLIVGKIYARSGRLIEATEVLNEIEKRLDDLMAFSGIGRSTRGDQAALNALAGEIALARGNHSEAEELFEMAYRLRPDSYVLESLAHGAFVAGDLDKALDKYQEILRRREIGWEAQEYWILTHVQLGRIHEEKGEVDRAINSYERLLRLWHEGDPDLVLLRDVQDRVAKLRGGAKIAS